MGRKKPEETPSTPAATSNTNLASSESFALSVIESLADPGVISSLQDALRTDNNTVADLVVAKLSSRFKRLEELIASKDKEISALKTKVQELENKLDDQEQYSRRTSIRISGIPETENEDPLQLTKEIFNDIGINPSINRIHRVGKPDKKRTSPRQILCQFTNYPDKKSVMIKKRDLRKRRPDIFIGEDLTRARDELFYLARQQKNSNLFKQVWTADGRIGIKKNDDSISYIIRKQELDKIIKAICQPR